MIELSQEKNLQGKDLAFILGVKEFLKHDPPTWLSFERASEIYKEIKDLS
jgi:hypothetical protein